MDFKFDFSLLPNLWLTKSLGQSEKLKLNLSKIHILPPWNSNENAGVSFVLTVSLPLGTFYKFIRLLIIGSTSVRNLSDMLYVSYELVFVLQLTMYYNLTIYVPLGASQRGN